jgi:hypothetical protein
MWQANTNPSIIGETPCSTTCYYSYSIEQGEEDMPVANRVSYLTPEKPYQVLAHAQELEAARHSIIHLEIGEPTLCDSQTSFQSVK